MWLGVLLTTLNVLVLLSIVLYVTATPKIILALPRTPFTTLKFCFLVNAN